MTKNNETHIFDDVFRTMEELTPELMIPLINEVFKTDYPVDAAITRLGDKHHLLKKLLETDSCMSIGEKAYHFEVESNPSSGIVAVRMFQYDVAVALGTRRRENGIYVIEFPASCVVYLRHSREKKDSERVIIRMADGQEIDYMIPVVRSQNYGKEEIFEKRLYILLPYYILRYEKQLKQMEHDEKRRFMLLEEYGDICDQLERTLGKENPLAYVELHKLMVRVLDYILIEQEEIRKGVEQVMGGKVLESFYDEVLRKGRTEGHAEGHAEGRAEVEHENYQKLVEKVRGKLLQGKKSEQIAEELVEELSLIRQICEEILEELNEV